MESGQGEQGNRDERAVEQRRADLEDSLEADALATARVTVELIRQDEAAEETRQELDHAVTLLAGALLGDEGEKGKYAAPDRLVE